MAALVCQAAVTPRAAAAAPRRAAAKAPTGSPLASRVPSHPAVALRPRRGGGGGAVCGMAATELAQVALEMPSSETITIVLSAVAGIGAGLGRGLHSSTFRLNVSAFCGIGGASTGSSGGVQEVLEGISGCPWCILHQKRLKLC